MISRQPDPDFEVPGLEVAVTGGLAQQFEGGHPVKLLPHHEMMTCPDLC
jgi:hypothetical protein